MIDLIKRFLLWQIRAFLSLYGPTLLTIIFAILFVHFFPDGPIWPVGVFFILIMIVAIRYLKW